MTSKILTASLLASALIAGFGAAPAMAQGTSTPRIDEAKQAISARIQQGMQSGHITPSEAQFLFRREREILMRENQFKSDGNASPQERQQLRAELDGLYAEVERMMNNRDVVGQRGNASDTPGIDNRKQQLGQLIDQGVRTGRINQRQADRLHYREQEYQRREALFRSDGVVTQQERRELRDELATLRDEVERMMARNERRARAY